MKKFVLFLPILLSCVIFEILGTECHETVSEPRKLSHPGIQGSISSRYTWVCRKEICTKIDKIHGALPTETPIPLDVCKLNCAKEGALWPLPTGKVELEKLTLNFFPQNVDFLPFQAEEPIKSMLKQAAKIFKSYLLEMHPDNSNGNGLSNFLIAKGSANDKNRKISISLSVVWPDTVVKIGVDESYTLALIPSNDAKLIQVSIIANTYFGVRHGLETLSQLIAFNDDTGTLTIVQQATITDKPAFTYRGILMDTARNFIPISYLKRLIDGLSYNKLNMFHWHITDTHSFPFQSKRLPLMTQYGAYSSRKIYTIEEMKDLVEYGRIRGVKVLPEFDAPAHVGHGWEWGPSNGFGNLAVCLESRPWPLYCVEPPCGQLNPINDKMYNVLGDLFKDFLDIFENDLFHMGGDEVHFNCWNTTDEITKWLIDNGRGVQKEDFVQLWAEFQERAYGQLKDANNGKKLDAILWTSELANEEHVTKYLSNSTYIIQIWSNGYEEGKIIPFLIKNGYRTIFSNVDPWYFDCGYGAWVGDASNNWCSPYKGWQQVYTNSPIKILANYTGEDEAEEAYKAGLILGGEAALWSEQVDEQSMESKIWPRGAALAERLWSNPSTDWYTAEGRMVHHRERLVDRGLHPDMLQPEWCHHNDKLCHG